MEILGLWRYPVKSMQGEARDVLEVAASGIAGDRRWGVQVAESGRILSAKREGRLLLAEARTSEPVAISLPSGECLSGVGSATDAALSDWLERPVRLVEADLDTTPTFESQSVDADDASVSVTWQGRPGGFVDSSPIHLLTTASLRAVQNQRPDLDWQVRRFRPNLLIDAPGDERVEDAWIGHRCLVGRWSWRSSSSAVGVDDHPNRAGGLERQLGVTRHLSDVADGNFGVMGRVLRAGPIALHDAVTVD